MTDPLLELAFSRMADRAQVAKPLNQPPAHRITPLETQILAILPQLPEWFLNGELAEAMGCDWHVAAHGLTRLRTGGLVQSRILRNNVSEWRAIPPQ